MKLMSRFLTSSLLAVSLSVPVAIYGMQAPAKAPAGKTAAKDATAAPSAQDIADAKSKGMVWVNTSTKVYHKEGPSYGATKHGKFMTEADAGKAGYRAAKEPAASKKKTAAAK